MHGRRGIGKARWPGPVGGLWVGAWVDNVGGGREMFLLVVGGRFVWAEDGGGVGVGWVGGREVVGFWGDLLRIGRLGSFGFWYCI